MPTQTEQCNGLATRSGVLLSATAIGATRIGSWLLLVLWLLGISVFLAAEFRVKAAEVAGIAIAAVALTMMGRALNRIEVSNAGQD
jgi:hypothetical protein